MRNSFDCDLYTYNALYTVPFKFIYYKDSQAHQYDGHQHYNCSAAVDAVTAVHQRSFKGDRNNN